MGYIPSVGENVRIRQWDDMADEFGFDAAGIFCGATFVNDMKHLCGKEFTVTAVSKIGRKNRYGDEYCLVSGCTTTFTISSDMIEPIDMVDSPNVVFDSSAISDFLNSMIVLGETKGKECVLRKDGCVN